MFPHELRYVMYNVSLSSYISHNEATPIQNMKPENLHFFLWQYRELEKEVLKFVYGRVWAASLVTNIASNKWRFN